jgi:hypothetical protein
MLIALPVRLRAPSSRYELVTRASREPSPAALEFAKLLRETAAAMRPAASREPWITRGT